MKAQRTDSTLIFTLVYIFSGLIIIFILAHNGGVPVIKTF